VINNFIISVVNSYHWTPDYCETLFVDKSDFKGLEFWYDKIKEQHDALNVKK